MLWQGSDARQYVPGGSGISGWAEIPEYRLEPARPLARFNAAQIALLEKLNRADRRHLRRLPSIVVPDRWELPELAYSPMPQFSSWAAEQPKALIVDLPSQLVRWGPLSSGGPESATPPGIFYLNWSARSRRSSIDETWLMEWYFNFRQPRHRVPQIRIARPPRQPRLRAAIGTRCAMAVPVGRGLAQRTAPGASSGAARPC